MEHNSLDRREFLLIGSAAAVGMAAVSASAGTLNAVARIEGVDPILSIGFAAADADRAVAAESLSFGDASFAGAARVTIHGLWRAETQAAPRAVHVSAFYPVGNERVPFLAWSSNASVAPRLSFNVGLDGRDSLALGIERERLVSRLRHTRLGRLLAPAEEMPDAAAIERAGGLATLGSEGMKLRRGTYFVALRNKSNDRKPDWSSLSVDSAELRAGGETVLRHAGRGVDFDYLAVSVEPV